MSSNVTNVYTNVYTNLQNNRTKWSTNILSNKASVSHEKFAFLTKKKKKKRNYFFTKKKKKNSHQKKKKERKKHSYFLTNLISMYVAIPRVKRQTDQTNPRKPEEGEGGGGLRKTTVVEHVPIRIDTLVAAYVDSPTT